MALQRVCGGQSEEAPTDDDDVVFHWRTLYRISRDDVENSFVYRINSCILEHMFALSSETPLEGLARVTREVNALEAERIQLAADYERSRVWTNKYRNAACGIADACNVTEGIARIWLEIAHTLEELPQTSDAFDKGDISSDKVKTISKAAKPERMEKLAERESDLLDAAKNTNSKKFTDEVKSLTDEIDGDNGLSEDERAFDQRGFDLVK